MAQKDSTQYNSGAVQPGVEYQEGDFPSAEELLYGDPLEPGIDNRKFDMQPWWMKREGASRGRLFQGREMRPGYQGTYEDFGAEQDRMRDRRVGIATTVGAAALSLAPTAEQRREKEDLAEVEDRLKRGEFLDQQEQALFNNLRGAIKRFGTQKRQQTEAQLAATGQTGAAAQIQAKEAEQRVVGEQEREIGIKQIEAGLRGARELREERAQRRSTLKQEQSARREGLAQLASQFAGMYGEERAAQKGEAASKKLDDAVKRGAISERDALMLRALTGSDREALIRAMG